MLDYIDDDIVELYFFRRCACLSKLSLQEAKILYNRRNVVPSVVPECEARDLVDLAGCADDLSTKNGAIDGMHSLEPTKAIGFGNQYRALN